MSHKISSIIKRPLIIASSGGGGHIAAAKGIVDDLRMLGNVDIIQHQAVLYQDRQSNPLRVFFRTLLFLKSFTYVSKAWDWFHQQTGISDVLEYHSFWSEIDRLKTLAIHQPQRPYVDLLLDLYPFGYEMTAIFNALQRRDQTEELLETIEKQGVNDWAHYVFIKAQIMALLEHQAKIGKPYTSIISTQPQSLSAMCDAVKWYNSIFLVKQNQELQCINHQILVLETAINEMEVLLKQVPTTTFEWLNMIWVSCISLYFAKREIGALNAKKQAHGDTELTPLRIEQYMTDLPTAGAVHFSSALKSLSNRQRGHINLYCLGEPNKELKQLNRLNIHVLKPDQNPMLRTTFRDTSALTHYTFTELDHMLTFQDKDEAIHRLISAKEKVASIMLGSVGGDASIDYIAPLLNKGYTHVFIFGAKSNAVIQHMIAQLPETQQACIIALDNQTDQAIAPIMARSNCVVTRSGGLSTMEQMAIPLIKNKQILIHHKNSDDVANNVLTSGLPWEDGNADCLIAHVKQHGAEVKKTCPKLVNEQLRDKRPDVLKQLTMLFFYKRQDKTFAECCSTNRIIVDKHASFM